LDLVHGSVQLKMKERPSRPTRPSGSLAWWFLPRPPLQNKETHTIPLGIMLPGYTHPSRIVLPMSPPLRKEKDVCVNQGTSGDVSASQSA
jgi:hypothetical protein